MNINVTFRQMDSSDAVRTYVEEKIGKLQKFLRQPGVAHVAVSVQGVEKEVEVQLSAGDLHVHGSQRGHDMYAAIDSVHDKLEAQILHAKGANVRAARHGASIKNITDIDADQND